MKKEELVNWIKSKYPRTNDDDIIEVTDDQEIEFYCSPLNDIDYCVLRGNVDARTERAWHHPPTYYAYLRLHRGAIVRRDYYSVHSRRILFTFYIRPE